MHEHRSLLSPHWLLTLSTCWLSDWLSEWLTDFLMIYWDWLRTNSWFTTCIPMWLINQPTNQLINQSINQPSVAGEEPNRLLLLLQTTSPHRLPRLPREPRNRSPCKCESGPIGKCENVRTVWCMWVVGQDGVGWCDVECDQMAWSIMFIVCCYFVMCIFILRLIVYSFVIVALFIIIFNNSFNHVCMCACVQIYHSCVYSHTDIRRGGFQCQADQTQHKETCADTQDTRIWVL